MSIDVQYNLLTYPKNGGVYLWVHYHLVRKVPPNGSESRENKELQA